MITLYQRRVRHTLILVIINALSVSMIFANVDSDAPVAQPSPVRSLRLPNDTYPLSYQLHISSNIHMGELRFIGNVTIDVAIRKTTNEIVMHAKELSDFEITVRAYETNELVDDLTHTYDSQGSFLIIHPRENYAAFEAGQRYRVEILYAAMMQKRSRGLYWMTYEQHGDANRTVYVAATQSEASYARLILPCYDEPAFKSNFTIKLTHGSNYTAISNMPVEHLEHHGAQNALKTTSFYATPPMCTYLIAFVISDFEYISETFNNVTQRIYTSPNLRNKGEKALKNAVRMLVTLEEYFGIKYPLEKLDHVALKDNYGAAMENWGLITYKEDNLLLDNKTDTYKWLRDTLTQGHEIVHQWFGNLVSPEWWTYTWMNEGFATYFSYIIADILYPEEKVMEVFISDVAERAYSYNHMAKRPMTHYVESETNIMSVFDIISYQRAACVIKMFHHAFHQKTFVRGISHFLQKFQYTVANEMNLFESLQMALLEDERFPDRKWVHVVPEIMKSWTHSEWIPIVSVTRNYENGTITFSQHSKHPKHERWWIPLNFATSQSPDFERTYVDYFMPPVPQHTLTLDELGLQLSGREWLILNKQQTGFYHVLYDTDNLSAIARQLQKNHSVIHPVNRAAIFQDLTSLIEHNNIESIEVIFELLKYLEYEEDLSPWSLVADTMEYFSRNLYGSAADSMYKNFVRRLVTPMFRRYVQSLDPANCTHSALLVSHKILDLACRADLPECLDYIHRLAHSYIFQRVDFHKDWEYTGMYDTVLCLGVRYLNDAEFNEVIALLEKSERGSLYFDDLIYALRCTEDHHHLRKYLNLLLVENSTHIIMNDKESMMYLLYLFSSNVGARPMVWHFLERNIKQLCRSPFFVENFNRIAQYIPEHHRPYFVSLRQNIAKEMELYDPNALETLINIDSNLVGKKIHSTEQFLEQFEQRIHKWLLNEQPSDIYAASLNVGNGSTRPGDLWRATKKLFRRAAALAAF